MIAMEITKLKNEAIQVWCLYGETIVRIFDLGDGYIEGTHLERIIKTNSETKIINFIKYVKSEINKLEQIEIEN